jgi:transcriptional regulator with XRE-family HTH domain
MATLHSPGERIVELRKTYSVSREDLAERSGVQLELIRRIEEEGLIPDLAPLIAIAHALGVRLGTLLDDHEALGPVVSRAGTLSDDARFVTGLPDEKDNAAHTKDHAGLHYHALAADKNGRHMEPFVIDIEPDAEQDKKPHEGEEFIFCMVGEVKIEYGEMTTVLHPGDSIYYDCIVPHAVHAAGDKPAKILAVIYTPV